MSKRRRAEQSNLPQAILERARQQAGVNSEEIDAEEPEHNIAPQPGGPSAASRRRKVTPAQLERARTRGELTGDMVRDMLANPTMVVTEADLRADYAHVLADLRNMGLLAGFLIILLVILAQFI